MVAIELGTWCWGQIKLGTGKSSFRWLSRRLPVDGIGLIRSVSNRRHRPAIDDIFGACNGRGTGRSQKHDEISNFFGFCRTAERYASEAVHDDLFSALVIRPGLFCKPLRQADGSFRLDPARRDTDDTYSLGAHFFGQCLAVVRQGGL